MVQEAGLRVLCGTGLHNATTQWHTSEGVVDGLGALARASSRMVQLFLRYYLMASSPCVTLVLGGTFAGPLAGEGAKLRGHSH